MGMPRTLLVLTNIPTPYRTNFFNCLSEYLAANGGRLVVAYCARTEWNRDWPFIPEDNRYEHHFIDGRSLKIGSLTLHFNPAVVPLLWRLRPTWLLSAGAWNMPTGIFALLVNKVLGGVSIFWSEGHADAVLHRRGVVAAVRRLVLKRYNAFAVPNQRSADFIASELGRPVKCIALPNTVDDSFYRVPSEKERAAARERFGLRNKDRVLVMVARLEHRKGVGELCDAAQSLFREFPHFKLVVVGTGTLERHLRERHASAVASGQLVLPGSLGAQDVREWLFAADGFVLTSRRDPNPLSPIEAALCSLPLILSRYVGNVRELLDEKSDEWTIPEISVQAVRVSLERFLQASGDALKCEGLGCAQRASLRFRPSRVAEEFLRSIGSLGDGK